MNKTMNVKTPVHQQAAQRVQPPAAKPTTQPGTGKPLGHGKGGKH